MSRAGANAMACVHQTPKLSEIYADYNADFGGGFVSVLLGALNPRAAFNDSDSVATVMTTNIIIYRYTPTSSRFSFLRNVSKLLTTGPRLLSPRPPPALGDAPPPSSSSVVCSSSRSSDMDATAGPNLYPSHRCKTIHLVRHAQGFHNVAGEKDHKEYLSFDYLDAQLTPLGWKQVANLRKHVQSCGLSKRIELVITSPLLRTIQTAVGTFGGEGYSDGIDVPPLMVENAWDSNHPAISSLNCPPFLAVELCREHLGVHPCDKRRSISEYRPLFPAIDFSMIEHDDDILWTPDIRELNEEVAKRGLEFLKWLWTRKEKEIAIVSHSGFLFHALSAFGNDCHPTIKDEICKHFANCELRSLVLVDRSMTGLDLSTTNFPGGLPRGLDLPSDIAAEMHPEEGVSN